jgi:hypothetical protein
VDRFFIVIEEGVNSSAISVGAMALRSETSSSIEVATEGNLELGSVG